MIEDFIVSKFNLKIQASLSILMFLNKYLTIGVIYI